MRIAILSSNYSDGAERFDPFRAELIRTFARAAQEMMVVQTTDYMSDDGRFYSDKAKAFVCETLRSFAPDLVFSLNRAGLVSSVRAQTSASVVSWYIDNPSRFPDSVREIGRDETVYCATRYQMRWLEERRKSGFKIGYLPFCTNNETFTPFPVCGDAEKCDVSFVGTLWEPEGFVKIVNEICETREAKLFLERGIAEYARSYNSSFPEAIRDRLVRYSVTDLKNSLDDFLSTQRRLAVLDALSDLDLEIYGTNTWAGNALLRSSRLFSCVFAEPLNTPEQLAALYRRTRVAVSIAHQQAQSGFPIRIFDILATGVPLVSDGHEEMDEFFGEGTDYLRADSPEEYSENVRRLLTDADFARSMGKSAMSEVREKHTFRNRVEAFVGKRLGDTAAGKVVLVSECLRGDFLLDGPRHCSSSIRRLSMSKRSPGTLPVRRSEPPGSINRVSTRFLAVGKQGTQFLSLFARYVLILYRQTRSGAMPVKEFSKRLMQVGGDLSKQHLKSISEQMRKMSSEISLLKQQEET